MAGRESRCRGERPELWVRQTWHRILAGGNPWATDFAKFGALVFKTVITGL